MSTVDPQQPQGTPPAATAADRRGAARRARLQAGAQSWLERVHQLRDLVHDHLGPRRDASPTFPFAWQNGGPIAASIGWPVLCAFVLMVAFSMAELTSRYPTAGGPYWWAHDLGGKGWSWMTGWFNIVGLIGIVASVAYGAALFLNAMLGLYGARHLRDQLRRHRAHPRRDLAPLRPDPDPLHAGQHLRRPLPGADEQHLGRLAPARRRDHHRDPGLRPRRPPELQLRLRRADQQLRPARRLHQQLRLLVPRAADRLPADDVHADRLRRLGPHRGGDQGARRSAPPRASGARSSSRR